MLQHWCLASQRRCKKALQAAQQVMLVRQGAGRVARPTGRMQHRQMPCRDRLDVSMVTGLAANSGESMMCGHAGGSGPLGLQVWYPQRPCRQRHAEHLGLLCIAPQPLLEANIHSVEVQQSCCTSHESVLCVRTWPSTCADAFHLKTIHALQIDRLQWDAASMGDPIHWQSSAGHGR